MKTKINKKKLFSSDIKSINQLTLSNSVFWECETLSTIYYYSLNEPKYSTSYSSCGSTSYGGTCPSGSPCTPFYCNTPDQMTVYVPKDYPSTKIFSSKVVTFKRVL